MGWRVKVTAHMKDGRTPTVWATADVSNPLIAPDCVTWDDDEIPDEMYGSQEIERVVWELVQIPSEEAQALATAAVEAQAARD